MRAASEPDERGTARDPALPAARARWFGVPWDALRGYGEPLVAEEPAWTRAIIKVHLALSGGAAPEERMGGS